MAVQFAVECVSSLNRNSHLHRLLQMNVEINFIQDGTAPILIAAEKGYADVMQILLHHGAKFRVYNGEGTTPMEIRFGEFPQNKKESAVKLTPCNTGAPGAIRTPDPLVRSQVLYPSELRAHGNRKLFNLGGERGIRTLGKAINPTLP